MSETSHTPSGPSPEEGGPGHDQDLTAVTLEGVRRRDPEALATFFAECFDLVYGLAFRMLGHRQGAEDVTQEVFLRVHRAASTLDPRRDPRPWLRTITANLCRDHWRSFGNRVARRSVSMDDDESPAPPLSADTPATDETLLAREREAAIQDAILELPPELREVVVLRDYEGLDHVTIADMVGASHAAVRKRYSRALTRLGELLEGEWP